MADKGFDPLYGARPLKRLIQTAMEDQLARQVLAGEVRDGQSVVFDVTDDREGLRVSDIR